MQYDVKPYPSFTNYHITNHTLKYGEALLIKNNLYFLLEGIWLE